MNEEVKIPSREELLGEQVPEQTASEQAPEQTPQLTEAEQRAVQLGWTPKDQWSGDPSAWRPADVWLDRGEMLRDISQLKSKLASTEKQVAEAFKRGVQMTEHRFKEEIATLRAARKEAFQEGDFDRVDKIEERIDTLKEQQKQEAKKPQQEPQAPPEFHVFLQRNPWYNSDKENRAIADGIGFSYLQTNPDAAPADLYFYVEQKMQQIMNKGAPQQKKSPPSPEGGKQAAGRSPAAGGGGSLSGIEAQMSDQDRSIMNTLVKTGVFSSKDEYLKEYQKAFR